jgi:uridine kinase
MNRMTARVIVLAGPSGAGKSHLAARLGLPIVRLDDFYRDGDDPELPTIALSGGDPIVDWDDPRSWDAAGAVDAIAELCRTGSTSIPAYDIGRSRRTGMHDLVLGRDPLVIAEGIFAQEIVGACRDRGVLAAAYCVNQRPMLTFVRRLTRDLAERRKPPWVLLRRGLHLMRRQRAIVAAAERAGCTVVAPHDAERLILGRAFS